MATAVVPFEIADVPLRVGQAVDFLASLEDGKAVRVPFSDVPLEQLRQALYQRAARLGVTISTRTEPSGLLVFRAIRKPRRRSIGYTQRNAEIRLSIDAMESYADIAARFGVSRQRIEQIALKGGEDGPNFTTGISPHDRPAALRSFLEPYFVPASKVATCPLCGGPATIVVVADPVCKSCTRAIRVLRRLKSILRSAANQTSQHAAVQAKYDIVRYGIKPEDLELV